MSALLAPCLAGVGFFIKFAETTNDEIMIKDGRLLKQLQTQLASINADREALKIEIANKQRQSSQLKIQAGILESQIANLNNKQEVKISEHAIIRYFERVKGYDIEQISKEIVDESAIALIEKLGGSGKYPVNNHQIVLKDYTVVTIL